MLTQEWLNEGLTADDFAVWGDVGQYQPAKIAKLIDWEFTREQLDQVVTKEMIVGLDYDCYGYSLVELFISGELDISDLWIVLDM